MKTEPRIYVGTYRKYNEGSIKGEWVDLTLYDTEDAFFVHIRELHKDEDDPEFMYQDFEGFPQAFHHESSMDDRLWEWLALDEYEQEIWSIYIDEIDDSASFEQARDAYLGTFSCKEDWAEEYLRDAGFFEKADEIILRYFDFESYARDCEYNGMHFIDVPEGVAVFDNS